MRSIEATSVPMPTIIVRTVRASHQRLHLAHRLAHADEHRAAHDRVADVQLADARQAPRPAPRST